MLSASNGGRLELLEDKIFASQENQESLKPSPYNPVQERMFRETLPDASLKVGNPHGL